MYIKRYEITHASPQRKLSIIIHLLIFGKALTLAIHPCWNMGRRFWPSRVCHRKTCYCTSSVEIFVQGLRSRFSFIIRSYDRLASKILRGLGAHICGPLRGAQLWDFRYYLLKSFLNFLCCSHYWCSFSLSCRISLSRCSWIFRWLMREKKSHHHWIMKSTSHWTFVFW